MFDSIMKLGILSDTHVNSLDEISPKIVDALADVDLIIHVGDFVGLKVLEGLREIKEVKAVRGNMDSFEIRNLLPDTDVFAVKGKKIGIIHGSGPPWGIEHRVREQLGELDIIIYGHSHEARNEVIEGVLLFNPGQGNKSYGILTIDKGVAAEIISI
jgi:putative phosphoesterase